MTIQNRKLVLIAIAFLAIPVLYAIEVNYLNRTLYASRLMTIAVVIGLSIGAILGYRLQKSATDAVARMRTYAACIILSVLVLPLLASWSNRLLSVYPVQQVEVEFVEESPRYSSRFGAVNNAQADSYLNFFYRNTELLKIQTSASLFSNAQRGDIVTLPIQKGLWGFEFVVQPSG